MDVLTVACEEKDVEISQLKQSVSQMYDYKEDFSQVSSKLMQAEERLAEDNEQLLAHKEEIQILKEALLAKQVRMYVSMHTLSVCLCHSNATVSITNAWQ